MGENDAITVLAENQSLNSYKRLRLSQSFETPQQTKERYEKCTPKQRKHSPLFDEVSWDKEKVQQDLEAWQHMSRSALIAILERRNAGYSDRSSDVELREKVAKLERKRTIGIWHDHATVLGHGYVLITAKVFYDPIVFKTELEISQTSHCTPNLQSVIEEPELHILAICSSSVEDQAALIEDRISCLKDLSIALHSTNGVEVKDELLYFYGDKPAQQMERGTQQGGKYKCGSCGCELHMMDDIAYSFRCKCRSLSDLQSIALAGKYGKQRGVVRPFNPLTPIIKIIPSRLYRN